MAKLSIQEIIEAIKELTLLEVNDLVKACETEFGVSAAAGVAVAGPAAVVEEEEKTEFNVELTECGAEKIKVIKVVREITKDELGPLHIGRNITEFKWDGTDRYGAKLANGVYLYRVLTNLNGQSLEKYKADGDKTDKYFTKGYGKMALIR